ncbi:hypothetical protein ACP70R_005518 [Stipagrostis hirtigluma subsp. patula]
METDRRRAKRARTSSPVPVPVPPSCRREWAHLPEGLAEEIAERVLSDDVAGCVRFRATCTAWRASCADPRAHSVFDRRFHPRRWIMLPRALSDGRSSRRRFLSVLTGESIRVRLPDLRCHLVLGPTAEGFVVLLRRRTLVVHLLNPLTGQLVDLPSASTLAGRRASGEAIDVKDYVVLNAGVAVDSTVALHFYGFSFLAVAKPGDKYWTKLDLDGGIRSAMPFAGRFYCASAMNIAVLETSAGQRPQLVPAADFKLMNRSSCSDEPYLAEIDGELLAIFTHQPSNPWLDNRLTCKVYRVDLDAGELVAMARLGGGAVFVSYDGGGRTVSVPAGLSPSIGADTVYFCHRYDRAAGRVEVDACRLVNGRIETDCRRRKCPLSLVDYISRYVAEIDRRELKRRTTRDQSQGWMFDMFYLRF